MASICLSYRLIFTFNEPHACFDNEIQDTVAKSLQSCLTLWDPMDCSLPGSFVHGDSPGWILEWIAMPSSRGSSQPRDGTHISYVSWIGRHVLYHQCHLGSPYQDTRINYKGRDRKEYVTCYPKFHGTKGKKKLEWVVRKKKNKTRKWCLRNLDIFFITLPKPSQEWLTPHIPEVVYTSESSVQFSSVTQSCMTLRHSC